MNQIEILRNQIIKQVKTCTDVDLLDLLLKLFPSECNQ